MKLSPLNYPGVFAFLLGIAIPMLSFTCGHTRYMASTDQVNAVTLDTTDCFGDRKSFGEVTVLNARINVISDTYIIVDESGNSRYYACNLPVAFHEESLQVSCTLVVKEIFPNERRFATPALLKEISVRE